MSEVTFANYVVGQDNVYDIGDGVIPEIADMFGHELSAAPDEDNLGDLIAKVGPAKTLQDNISSTRETLGHNTYAIDVAREWVERSGLLVPVDRLFSVPQPRTETVYETAIITGGVRNWMVRRAARLEQAVESGAAPRYTLLGASSRVMNTREGDDVTEGMSEADYMRDVVAPRLGRCGLTGIEVITVETKSGDDVAEAVATSAKKKSSKGYTVVANAGNWPQNAGQIARALGQDVHVISDAFPLGITGEEEPATHQNPLTALGALMRNAQELTRH